MPRTQARVAELVGVVRRATQPAAQEPEELLPGAVQLGAVGGALAGAVLALMAGWWGLREVLRRPVVETLRRAAE